MGALHELRPKERKTQARRGRKDTSKLSRTALATAGAIPATGALLGWLAASTTASGSWWAILPGLLTAAALLVTLPHVALGLERVLHCSRRDAVALALVIDLSMLVSEALLHSGALAGPEQGIAWVVIVVGLVGSTAYNIHGFRE